MAQVFAPLDQGDEGSSRTTSPSGPSCAAAGVTLVSASENLDETASGRLVEGIHALMAEFYSANLANEVKKGMGQKAKLGGYLHKAPFGYLSVREPIGGGRQVAHIVDPERAPLVRSAFELYASGEWTVERLTHEKADRGLKNRGRADYAVKALTVSGLARMQANLSFPRPGGHRT